MPKEEKSGLYKSLVAKLFAGKYKHGMTRVEFTRDDIRKAAADLKMALPKNLGDVIYSIRYRSALPPEVSRTERDGKKWLILGTGISKYAFRLMKLEPIVPTTTLATIKIPESTPEIVSHHAQGDEQALLAKVRYNRIIDIFLGIAAYSLQSHLRTTVEGIGQVELDEVYVGVDRAGRQYVIPVQAKGGKDKHSPVQTLQDIACCREKFPNLICRPISAQFMADQVIAMFETTEEDDGIKIVEEKHYKLVPADQIGSKDLASYGRRRSDR